jgi:hypothetical protein
MSNGGGVFASSNKDDEEFNKFGKKKIGNQQPYISVHHCGFETMHNEIKPTMKSLALCCHGPRLCSSGREKTKTTRCRTACRLLL